MAERSTTFYQLNLFGGEEPVMTRVTEETELKPCHDSNDPKQSHLFVTSFDPEEDENDLEDEMDLSESFPTKGALDMSLVRNLVERRDAVSFHYELEQLIGEPIDLIVNKNRTRAISIKRGKNGRIVIRVQHIFVFAERKVIEAVAALFRGERSARVVLRQFIRSNAEKVYGGKSQLSMPIYQQGEVYNLTDSLQKAVLLVRKIFPNFQDHPSFPGQVVTHHAETTTSKSNAHSAEPSEAKKPKGCQITWGRNGKGRRSIRFGSYSSAQRLIRIHPALDQAWVPQDYLDFVVYHEYLHHVIPVEFSGGRRIVHSAKFRRAERLFPNCEKLLKWEADNLHRFLRRKR